MQRFPLRSEDFEVSGRRGPQAFQSYAQDVMTALNQVQQESGANPQRHRCLAAVGQHLDGDQNGAALPGEPGNVWYTGGSGSGIAGLLAGDQRLACAAASVGLRICAERPFEEG